MYPDRYEKIAFSTDKRNFEFTRIPFGLKGAPAMFQRFMNTVLISLNWLKTLVYIDNIIIYARSIEYYSK